MFRVQMFSRAQGNDQFIKCLTNTLSRCLHSKRRVIFSGSGFIICEDVFHFSVVK